MGAPLGGLSDSGRGPGPGHPRLAATGKEQMGEKAGKRHQKVQPVRGTVQYHYTFGRSFPAKLRNTGTKTTHHSKWKEPQLRKRNKTRPPPLGDSQSFVCQVRRAGSPCTASAYSLSHSPNICSSVRVGSGNFVCCGLCVSCVSFLFFSKTNKTLKL